MITVEVRCYANLQQYCPDLKIAEPLVKVLNHETKLEDLLDEIRLPREDANTVFVNGRWEEESYLLRDGDKIIIFPPIGGG